MVNLGLGGLLGQLDMDLPSPYWHYYSTVLAARAVVAENIDLAVRHKSFII
jgi:hypothetical protein